MSEASARPRVLISDDEPVLVALVERLIQREFDVVVSTSGECALSRFARVERFDVVLCDLMMPETTGMEVHERVRAEHPELLPRIVFMTGGAVSADARAFLARFDPPRLDKPFTAAELRAALRRAIEPPQPA